MVQSSASGGYDRSRLNAVRHGISRDSTAGRLAVRAAARGDTLELRVEDEGPGMDETTMRRAFEPFFTTSPFGERTGLGLSMVHGVVQQNGAEVLLESRKGEGTCVRIRWPVLEAS